MKTPDAEKLAERVFYAGCVLLAIGLVITFLILAGAVVL